MGRVTPHRVSTMLLFICWCFVGVHVVLTDKLQLVPTNPPLQSVISANFPFDPPLQLEVVDDDGKRTAISEEVTATLIPDDACLSDSIPGVGELLGQPVNKFTLVNGLATWGGSICKPVGSVNIKFTTASGLIFVTKNVKVTGDIHLGNFVKRKWGYFAEYQSFMENAVQMVNEGLYGAPPYINLFAGHERTVKIKSYYTDYSLGGAMNAYKEMKKVEQAKPEEKAHALIGMSDDVMTKTMTPLLNKDGYSLFSFTGDYSEQFSNKAAYPHFNRISYSEESSHHALGIYLKQRHWTKIMLISDSRTELGDSFYTTMRHFNITLIREYKLNEKLIKNCDAHPLDSYDGMFTDMKTAGTKIVVTMVQGEALRFLLVAAMKNNFTNSKEDMIQWLGVGMETRKAFPRSNHECKRCFSGEPAGIVPFSLKGGYYDADQHWCIFRFKGMQFLEPNSLYGGGRTHEWMNVALNYFERDPLKQRGNQQFHTGHGLFRGLMYRSGNEAVFHEGPAVYALAYDAVLVNLKAMKLLIDEKKTISGPSLALKIRESTFEGLSQTIKFDNKGNREGFEGLIWSVWPDWYDYLISSENDWSIHKARRQNNEITRNTSNWDVKAPAMHRTALMKITGDEVVEVLSNLGHDTVMFTKERNPDTADEKLQEYFDGYYMDKSSTSPYTNRIKYNSLTGVYDPDRQQHMAMKWGFPGSIHKNYGCYGAPEPMVGVPKERTQIVPAPYFCTGGCGHKIRDDSNINIFDNGECIYQDRCECKEGWSGEHCQTALCSPSCVHGKCVKPNQCNCTSGWNGTGCSAAICSNCVSPGGKCVNPEICKCDSTHYGPGCAIKCSCVHGKCNTGVSGDGKCTCDSGYFGDDCQHNLAAIVAPTVICILFVVLVLYFSIKFFLDKARMKAALFNNDWIVSWNELKRHDEVTGRSSLFLSAVSMNQGKERRTCNTGIWNGIDVHYQRLDKDSIVITDDLRREVKKIREIRHTNLISFVGACIDSPNVCLLTEIAPKGSLEDVLHNEDIMLPWDFRYPLMKGVCQGLQALHNSNIGFHGRLRSTNILVDNRWSVRLTGFGLNLFRKNQRCCGDFSEHQRNQPIDLEKSNYGSLLWTAPELLRKGIYHIDHVLDLGSKESDMYSLAMVLAEFCTRDHPFADVMLEKSEIIGLIKGDKDESALKEWNNHIAKLNMESGGLIRPCITDKQWPKKFEQRKALKKLMETCWHEDPSQRPEISSCIREIERIDPQSSEIMDRLVKMLEKYSTNLEEVVAKRTKQLSREKQKTEDLVGRLLPKTIADDLKLGKRVEPEQFDFCTIFFSDIVGFTNIAKASTPLQVVTFLNDVYTSFDGISANYDVYKVETIGDAYMIVSGLPVRNGDKHAGEICTCAMDLLCSTTDFVIRHMPERPMQLRIGIHTGYVVAGVVGLKMPRYCLFGDTVNVGAKMESGGLAMRIHVSQDTVDILERLGGYNLTYRDEVDIKGRGLVKTYWLNGKDGYSKTLPIPPPEE